VTNLHGEPMEISYGTKIHHSLPEKYIQTKLNTIHVFEVTGPIYGMIRT
jgi:hypothetical protein